MSHYIDYDDPKTWEMVRESHLLDEKASVEELQKQLALALGDAEVWAEAEAGEDETDLGLTFGFTVDGDYEHTFSITEFDRCRRIAELYMSAAMLHKKLGVGSEFDRISAEREQMEYDEGNDRRAAILAQKAKSVS